MLAKAPEERPSSPAEIAAALARLLGRTVSAPVPMPQRPEVLPTIAGEPFIIAWGDSKPIRCRPSWLVWALAGLVPFVLFGMLLVVWKGSNPQAAPSVNSRPEGKPFDFSNGFTARHELTLNGSAAVEAGSLRLTSSDPRQAGSAFTSTKQRIDRFDTHFRFRLLNARADGFTFTIQSVMPTALGPSGGGLGYGPDLAAQSGGGIPRSVAVKFDLYDNEGEGYSSTGLYCRGVAPTVAQSIDLLSRNIDLRSGHDFSAVLSYDGQVLQVTITDLQTRAAASQSYRSTSRKWWAVRRVTWASPAQPVVTPHTNKS
jgi:Legume lectin domain